MELRWPVVSEYLRGLLRDADDALCAYLYDLEALRRHAARLTQTLPRGCELFYAIKANSDLPILQTLAPLVHGFEVSSGGELGWVRQHFPAVPTVFSGPGKTDRELRQALHQGVDALHVESLGELQRLAPIAREHGTPVAVMLRINLPLANLAATSLMMGGGPTPFGIAADQLPGCLDWLRFHPEIRVRGFHFHLLSHQLDAAAHLDLLAGYLSRARQWREEYGLELDCINVGGGIGINYREPGQQFDWAAFAAGLQRLASSSKAGNGGPRIRFECGRYLTAACGFYAMQVIDLKQAFGRNFAVARGGTHHFRTPYAQGHSHPFRVLAVDDWPHDFARPQFQTTQVSVVGQLCTPKDLLAFDAPVERVRCGDLLVFPYAGAYAWHISHHDFLRHPHPAQHYLSVEHDAADQ